MESKNKQAGMPTKEDSLHQILLLVENETMNVVDARKKIIELLCPPPKSEAEVALKKAIEFIREEGIKAFRNKANRDVVEYYSDFADELSKSVSAPSKGKYTEWISVEDRLPDEEQRVLCYGKGDRMFTTIYKKGAFWAMGWDGEPRTFDIDDAADFIEYWKPLDPSPESSNPETKK